MLYDRSGTAVDHDVCADADDESEKKLMTKLLAMLVPSIERPFNPSRVVRRSHHLFLTDNRKIRAQIFAITLSLSATSSGSALAPNTPRSGPLLSRTNQPYPTEAAITVRESMTRTYIVADDSMQGRDTGKKGGFRLKGLSPMLVATSCSFRVLASKSF